MDSAVTRQPSLVAQFDVFFATLQAATVPEPGGGRRVDGVAHAVLLSEAVEALHQQLAWVCLDARRRFGKWLTEPLGDWLEAIADGPDSPSTPMPPTAVEVFKLSVGRTGADAAMMAAVESALRVTAFPADKWNRLQDQSPGHLHLRYQVGDVIDAQDLLSLESVSRLLQLPCHRSQSAELAKSLGEVAHDALMRKADWFKSVASIPVKRLEAQRRAGSYVDQTEVKKPNGRWMFLVTAVMRNNPEDAALLQRAFEAEISELTVGNEKPPKAA